MAHRGRFVITPISNPDLPADLSFNREPQQSPKAPADKDKSSFKVPFQGLNHEQESNKPDTSPKLPALFPSFSYAQPRRMDSLQVPDSVLHESPTFPSASPRGHRNSHGNSQTSEAEDSSLVPMSLVTLLQESLCGRFTEMMQLHREMMSEVAARDMRRDEQMSLLVAQNVELVKTVVRLKHEQAYLHPRSK